ncbi:MAG: hypothetical protein ILO36_07720 [Abditibacteriota bacterium]|nr:hypothetical protein [Abditibacteriota bacterium]
MKILIASALYEEVLPIIKHYSLTETEPRLFSRGNLSLLITGVGLLRVAAELSVKMAEYDYFFNIGTCGSLSDKYGVYDIIEPRGFIQGDFDGFELDTPNPANRFDPCYLKLKEGVPGLCSVNRFITEPVDGAELVDMEGYAFVALMEKWHKPYRVFKIVSDSGDHDEFHDTVSRCVEKNLEFITKAVDAVLGEDAALFDKKN